MGACEIHPAGLLVTNVYSNIVATFFIFISKFSNCLNMSTFQIPSYCPKIPNGLMMEKNPFQLFYFIFVVYIISRSPGTAYLWIISTE